MFMHWSDPEPKGYIIYDYAYRAGSEDYGAYPDDYGFVTWNDDLDYAEITLRQYSHVIPFNASFAIY